MFRVCAVRFALLALLSTFASGVRAETYKQDIPDAKFDKWAKINGSEETREAGRILTGQSPTVGAETLFTDLLEKGAYPLLTHSESIPHWVKLKISIKTKFFNQAKVQEVLDIVNRITLKKMHEYATDNYDLIVRYQSMIFLGELNQSLPGTPTEPYHAATAKLAEAAVDAKLPSSIRVAALLGLKRHAEYNVPDAVKKDLGTKMLAIVKTKTPVPGESQEGQNWLRRRAAEVAQSLKIDTPDVKEALSLNVAAPMADATATATAPK